MTVEPNPQDFEALRKLLALKQHETPPPGYFNTLSSKICSRIEAREEVAAASLWGRLFSGGIKPVLAYSFVLSVCSLIAYTVSSFFNLEPQPMFASDSPVANKSRSASLGLHAVDYKAAAPWLSDVADQNASSSTVSGMTIAPATTSLMIDSLVPRPKAQTVSYQLVNGN
jgi:hypothetical protein